MDLDEKGGGRTSAAPVAMSSERPLPKSVGVYDRPRVKRSTRILLVYGAVVVAILIVLVILLR